MVGAYGPSEMTRPGPFLPMATRGQSLPSLRTQKEREEGFSR